ncbi:MULTISPECIES: flavin reductase family protein [unclassified Streptomyces]|uniref:flavin reductase family protein n=1 Tax=unclassified Streptomyces TaxID=2593676 RepID=UPI002E17D0DE|nr:MULTISPECIES: flavin reductase family protein [unclassified Streptomyces]
MEQPTKFRGVRNVDRAVGEPLVLERFAGVPYRLQDSVPVLEGAVAAITCRVHGTHPGGDHTILVGAVTDTSHTPGRPLLRHRGAYRSLI